MLKSLPHPAGVAGANVRPRMTPENEPFHDGLAQGRLMLCACIECGRVHGQAVPSCPHCGGQLRWKECSGAGAVHSWVRYHRAFMPEFAKLVPYCVAAVRLDEGAIVFGRCVAGAAEPRIGQRVQAVSEAWADGFCSLAFELSQQENA